MSAISPQGDTPTPTFAAEIDQLTQLVNDRIRAAPSGQERARLNDLRARLELMGQLLANLPQFQAELDKTRASWPSWASRRCNMASSWA